MKPSSWHPGAPPEAGFYRARFWDGSCTVGLKTPTGKFLIPGMVEDQTDLVSHHSPTKVVFPPPPAVPDPVKATKKPTTGWWLVPTHGKPRPWYVDRDGLVRVCPGDAYAQLWTSKDFDWRKAKKLEER